VIPSDEMNGQAIGERVRGAVLWRSGSQILGQLISWGTTLFVIRILEPSDYGLFAMTQVILAFLAFLGGYGFASALIQSETLEPIRVRQAFGMLLLLNGGLALVQILIAPLAADYYNQPQIADLLRWQSLLYLASPFMVVPQVLMSRRLEFKRPAIITLISTALGAAAAISLALSGAGVWTLVAAPIVIFWTRAIGLIVATRFYVLPSFDFRGAGAMFGFGTTLLASHGFWIVQSQADIFIAGRLFDAHTLGLYAEALFLTHIFVSRFVPPLNDVAFPAYARIQNDKERLASSFLTALRLIMVIAMPLYLGLAITSAAAVETLFGPKWVEMAPLVAIISLAMPFMTLQILFAPALNALGKPGVTMRTAAFGAVLMPVTFLIAARYGAIGLAWGWLAAMPLHTAFSYYQARPHIGIDLKGLAGALKPSVAAAAAMAALVWLLQALLPPVAAPAEFALLTTVGALFYAGLLRLAAPRLVEQVLGLVRGRKMPASLQTAPNTE
jgi:O-antigen/teichoic acid export membrane protein